MSEILEDVSYARERIHQLKSGLIEEFGQEKADELITQLYSATQLILEIETPTKGGKNESSSLAIPHGWFD